MHSFLRETSQLRIWDYLHPENYCYLKQSLQRLSNPIQRFPCQELQVLILNPCCKILLIEGSAREPAEVLASRRATLLAPGRTPTKTYLKSPAGRVQTPKLSKLDSPLRVPLVREFSFAGFEPDEEDEELAPANVDLDVIRSPTERLVPHSSKARGLTQRSRTATYEEQEDEEEEEETEQVELEEQPEDAEMGFNGGNDYDYGGYGGGDGFGDDDYDQGEPMEDEVEEQEVEEQYVDEPLQQEEDEEDIYGEQFSPAQQPVHSKPAPAKQSSKPKQAAKPRKRQPKQTSSKPSTSTLPPKSPRVIPKIVERRIVPTVEEEDANGEGTFFFSKANNSVRRSKRIRVAPLAHWKGERIVYELEGRRASGPALPRIKEIVKIDTPPEPSRRQPTTTTTRKRKSRQDSDSEDDDSDAGEVFTTIKSYEEDGLIDDYRIAVSRSAINPRPLQGSKIRFEKLFQDGEYMATGVLDIGVGGEKGIKSTKHAFLSFVVMTGKAEVKVHRTAFVIGKGGVFVVPRGK